jgi:hypothetical protein
MQTLGKVWDRYYTYTEQASATVRNSAIAGLAAAWLFSGSSDGDLGKLASAPHGMLWAGTLFAASLGLDVMQYFSGSLAFRQVARSAEKNAASDEASADLESPVVVPLWAPLIPRLFYFAKVTTLVAGYVVLVVRLAQAAH